MRRRRIPDNVIVVATGALRGAGRGGLAGAALAVATGAAVAIVVPGSFPAVGGLLVVKASTVAAWSVAGSIVGAVAGGIGAHARHRRQKAKAAQFVDEMLATPATA